MSTDRADGGTSRSVTAGGVVLAGGRSSRMGRDKAGVPWRGTTLLGHVLEVLADAVDGPLVVVSAADRPAATLPPLDDAVRRRVVVVRDPVPGRGPLQGLATGLGALAGTTDRAAVASVDLPLLHPAFVRAVLARLPQARLPGAPLPDPAGSAEGVEVVLPVLHGHRQPLAAAYATALGARAARLLDEGAQRPGQLFAASRVLELDADALLADAALRAADPDLDAVRGANTPEELAELARVASERGPRP